MANRIRELREDRDLKQADVATITGIDQRTLSNYETGKTNPDSYAIIKLAEYFNVTCDYLLGITNKNYMDNSDIEKEINEIEDKLELLKRRLKYR